MGVIAMCAGVRGRSPRPLGSSGADFSRGPAQQVLISGARSGQQEPHMWAWYSPGCHAGAPAVPQSARGARGETSRDPVHTKKSSRPHKSLFENSGYGAGRRRARRSYPRRCPHHAEGTTTPIFHRGRGTRGPGTKPRPASLLRASRCARRAGARRAVAFAPAGLSLDVCRQHYRPREPFAWLHNQVHGAPQRRGGCAVG